MKIITEKQIPKGRPTPTDLNGAIERFLNHGLWLTVNNILEATENFNVNPKTILETPEGKELRDLLRVKLTAMFEKAGIK